MPRLRIEGVPNALGLEVTMPDVLASVDMQKAVDGVLWRLRFEISTKPSAGAPSRIALAGPCADLRFRVPGGPAIHVADARPSPLDLMPTKDGYRSPFLTFPLPSHTVAALERARDGHEPEFEIPSRGQYSPSTRLSRSCLSPGPSTLLMASASRATPGSRLFELPGLRIAWSSRFRSPEHLQPGSASCERRSRRHYGASIEVGLSVGRDAWRRSVRLWTNGTS